MSVGIRDYFSRMEVRSMNVALAPFIVEGLIILAAALFGFLLGKKGKPYGKVRLIFHLFFILWFSAGYYFIFAGTIGAISPTLVPVIVMGLALLLQLIIGIMMLASKEPGKVFPTIHKVSAVLMLLADICGLVLVAAQ
jgi:hypothetical protein